MGGKECAETKPDVLALEISIRVLGALIILFSVIEIGVGGAAYSFLTNVKVGAWWGSLLPIAAGVLALIYKPRGILIAAIVVSVIGAVVAVIASAVDGASAFIISLEQACVSSSGVYSGATSIIETFNIDHSS